jgi:hypothetical protein
MRYVIAWNGSDEAVVTRDARLIEARTQLHSMGRCVRISNTKAGRLNIVPRRDLADKATQEETRLQVKEAARRK